MIRAKPPYTDHPGNQTNIKDWLRGQRQRQEQRAEQRKRWSMPPRGPLGAKPNKPI